MPFVGGPTDEASVESESVLALEEVETMDRAELVDEELVADGELQNLRSAHACGSRAGATAN